MRAGLVITDQDLFSGGKRQFDPLPVGPCRTLTCSFKGEWQCPECGHNNLESSKFCNNLIKTGERGTRNHVCGVLREDAMDAHDAASTLQTENSKYGSMIPRTKDGVALSDLPAAGMKSSDMKTAVASPPSRSYVPVFSGRGGVKPKFFVPRRISQKKTARSRSPSLKRHKDPPFSHHNLPSTNCDAQNDNPLDHMAAKKYLLERELERNSDLTRFRPREATCFDPDPCHDVPDCCAPDPCHDVPDCCAPDPCHDVPDYCAPDPCHDVPDCCAPGPSHDVPDCCAHDPFHSGSFGTDAPPVYHPKAPERILVRVKRRSQHCPSVNACNTSCRGRKITIRVRRRRNHATEAPMHLDVNYNSHGMDRSY